MRATEKRGAKGSLKWIQSAVNDHSTALNAAIRSAGRLPASWSVDWVSPLSEDRWAAYRDAAFLEKIGVPHLCAELAGFWPRKGPQWDALGRTSDGGVLLVEAVSHVEELKSECDASERSRRLIESSLAECRQQLGASSSTAWTKGYYQYANRLAHLSFLRSRGVKARLAFVYFYGDTEGSGPTSTDGWRQALRPVYQTLGLAPDLSTRGVFTVFMDTKALAS